MIAIDTKTQAAKNISTAEATGNEPLSRSKITYVSGIGEKGILVLIGGSSKKIVSGHQMESAVQRSHELIRTSLTAATLDSSLEWTL